MVEDYLRTVRGNEKRLEKAKNRLGSVIRYQVKDMIKIYSDTYFKFADMYFVHEEYHYILGKEGLFVSNELIPLVKVNPDNVPFEKFDANILLKLGEDIRIARDLYDELGYEAMPVDRAAREKILS